jgi:uncharacterized caspase-like protein
MATKSLYLPKYAESRALVIGINNYQHVSPLHYACNDAEAIAEMLVDRFSFPEANVTLLLDLDATRESILRTFLRYADKSNIAENDRILIFFAGHGHTISGRRGEIGYLVPVDGKADDLSTLLRWDDLTRNADLIPAKHMLFLMDACYGGLALTRTTIPPGNLRLLKDMLQRYARQVLTAGKADEVVSDSGGTRPEHSIFTSHLLDGMEGAASGEGILTGNGLMAYVYDKVGNDSHSRQTPHYGFIDGDGDFIFDTSALAALEAKESSNPESDLDVFIKAPAFARPVIQQQEDTIADLLKRLIASPADKIRLNDCIQSLLRIAAERLSPEKFPVSTLAITNEEVASRVQKYEDAVADLLVGVILLAHYADREQIRLLEGIFAHVAEFEKPQAGVTVWIRLAWYPVLVLMYAAGISALASGRVDTLRAALLSRVYPPRDREDVSLVLPVIDELTEVHETFKKLPDMERKFVPRSEHLYKKLQPILEDQLFLGRRYDSLFDQFEILLALTYADLRDSDVTKHIWGPPGRFAWKQQRSYEPVFTRFVNQAKEQGPNWQPLKAGFFQSSPDRFAIVADAYEKLLNKMSFF